MQDIQFLESKSGHKTCSINKIRLHSSYDPIKEAQRFVSGLDLSFSPSIIVITEPALSYCVSFLRKTYPTTTLVAIRFTHIFDDYNYLWDRVIYSDEIDSLLNIYGEDQILSTGFFSWQPSQQIFFNEYIQCWKKIQLLVQTSRDILGTRAYFAKRWLKNTLSYFYRLNNISVIQGGSSPILLVASGPSLKSSLEQIKKHRDDFFIIALSSALSPLLAANIKPDICISTDGGFWAKKHIDKCPVPIALPAEAAIPACVFNQTIVPLKYGDGPETELFNICNIPAMDALRNGTVSGTAIDFALSISKGPIFACGLDLSNSFGYQHSQPNCIEIFNSQKDFRLSPKASRLYPQELPSQSLEIYAQWFTGQSKRLKDRFYRLSTSDYIYSNTLGEIKDINWNDFEIIYTKYKKNIGKINFPFLKKEKLLDNNQRFKFLLSTLNKYKETGLPVQWLITILPVEHALLLRNGNNEEVKTKIKEKESIFLNEMIDYLKSIQENGYYDI